MPSHPKPIAAHELKARLDAGERLVVLDVREPDEVAIGRIAGAVHIPMNEVPQRLAELDPEAPIVAYCHHGMRSHAVGSWLLTQGFAEVYNLNGGIDAWATAVEPGMARY